jgi:hypothetical protein
MQGLSEFAKSVGELVQSEYGLDDGADLCYNLVESGAIDMKDGEASAARQVAMHIEQA